MRWVRRWLPTLMDLGVDADNPGAQYLQRCRKRPSTASVETGFDSARRWAKVPLHGSNEYLSGGAPLLVAGFRNTTKPIKVNVHDLEGHHDRIRKCERCTINKADASLTNVDNGTRTSRQVTTTVHNVVHGEPARLRSITANATRNCGQQTT